MYIGIDLGTSNSTIAGAQNGQVRTYRPADGGEALPSAIFIDKPGHRLYGRRAHDQAFIAPESVAVGFKRLMGTSTPVLIKSADMSLSPEECSAEILRQLIGQVQTETGEESFDGVVIAVPAAFNQLQAEATMRAAQLAGLSHVSLIQEPIAAAMAAMAEAKRSGLFLIYDLGGGTFDLALIESDKGDVRIRAQQGINMLGGRDFDRLIVQEIVRPWLLANFDLPETFLRDPHYQRLARIALLAAEKAKIELSSQEEAAVFASDEEVRLVDQNQTEIFIDAPLTRGRFEELIRHPLEQTTGVIRTLLEEEGVSPAEVDRVVFVGGPSRIPLVRRMVTELLGIEADLKTDPMTAVAEGAALYAEGRVWKEDAPPAPAQLPAVIESEAKPTHAQTEMTGAPDLFFDYDVRTPDETTLLCINLEGDPAGRQVELTGKDWTSGPMALTSGLCISLPLPQVGEHRFEVRLLDSNGQPLAEEPHALTVTRLVAAPKAVPAAHAIAVKVRQSLDAEENAFLFLVQKGDDLPASGDATLKSAANLKPGEPGALTFEVFQVDVPDRVDVNLCVGVFRLSGADLPEGQFIRTGDAIVFRWRMNEGGILSASVLLPSSGLSLPAPRFYAPQAAQQSFAGELGHAFAGAVLGRAREEWGDLAAAVGPQGGPELALLKTRLNEQADMLAEAADDPERLRQISEEARFIRQDAARLSRKYEKPLLQRRLGKTAAAFNRTARARASEDEVRIFDDLAAKVQQILDSPSAAALPAARLCLTEMRRLFFAAAWRNPGYARAMLEHLAAEPWLFADQDALAAALAEGRALVESGDMDALREHVQRLLETRIALGASDEVGELASLIVQE